MSLFLLFKETSYNQYGVLAKAINANAPTPSFDQTISEIELFEKDYDLICVIASAITELSNMLPEILEILKPDSQIKESSELIQDFLLDKMTPLLDILKSKRMIDYSLGRNVLTFGHKGGNKIEFNVHKHWAGIGVLQV